MLTIHDTLGPTSSTTPRILLINPNSTLAFTQETVSHLSPLFPSSSSSSPSSSSIAIDFYTAPSPAAPPSIDGTLDGVLSAAAVLAQLDDRELEKYDAVVVSCFSSHPLVGCLRERGDVRLVLGILEAGVYLALQMGGSFGIATTGLQWEPLFDDAVRGLGLSQRYVGTKGTGFNAISLHGEGPTSALLEASVWLANERGARVIVLGCAGMAPMRADIERKLQERVGRRIPVVDGVQAAVESAIGCIRMGLTGR